MRPLIGLALLAAPSAAIAACPTANDLSTGIRFEVSGGDAEVFTTFGESSLQSIYFIGDDPVTRVLLARGLYLLEVVDIDESGALDLATRSTYAYAMPPGELPLPKAGSTYSAEYVLTENGQPSSETELYSFGQETGVSFGACEYAAIPIDVRYGNGDIDELMWLPELGLSYLTRSIYDGGDDRYYYLSISIEAP
ncbi:hypothetical protein [Thalassococcus lentus]|uniref:DUF4397 domain-containing protein n=1 Tax=Thalassococcus lentus TaxID=1210524 RepID=A0ABT4XVE8_9RHOB|nr:hypothetical protein [Thalassococcus lentus]MDA7425944.1 hypothetical protein [Thalassococcus lentus]